MKKIDKLIIRAFIGPFILTTAVVVFIFLMRFLMMYFNDFIGKDLGLDVFGKLFIYFSLITIPISLPLSTLLATLMCYGNLGEHTEITAMKSAGIPLSRLIRPILVFVFFVSVFSLIYNNYVNPWANLKGYSLLWDVKTAKVTLNIQEGIFYREIPGYRIKVQDKYPDGVTLKNVMVYDHTANNGNKSVTVADSGKMYSKYNNTYLVFELFNGYNYIDQNNGFNQYNETQFVKNKFKKNQIIFSLESFGIKRTDENQFKYHEYMKNIAELTTQIDSTNKEIKNSVKSQVQSLQSLSVYQFKPVQPVQKVSAQKDTTYVVIKPGPWIEKRYSTKTQFYRDQEMLESAISQSKNLKSQLETNDVILTGKLRDMYRADVERWHKLTMAISCLVMFMIGAALGSIIKKGGFGMPVLLSISFFIFMYVLMQLGDKYAKEGIIPVVVGVWIPNFILLLIGIFLMYKASNDARLFESDIYNVYIDRVKNLFQKIKLKRQLKISNNYS